MFPTEITNLASIQKIIASELVVLVYFSTQNCCVGEAILPKVEKLIRKSFPKATFLTVDLNFAPKISAHYSVFVEPTILVFYNGKETLRKSRNISIYELETAIKRPYKLIFE